MIPDRKRVTDLLGIGEDEAGSILREMAREYSSLDSVDSLPPNEFASAASRAYKKIREGLDTDRNSLPPLPLPDRADGLAKLLDTLISSGSGARRRALDIHLESQSLEMSKVVGSEMVLTRRGRALVPFVDSTGKTSYRIMRFRDLDMEEFTDTERRVVEASRDAILGRDLSVQARADLINFITIDSDATAREATQVVMSIERLNDIEPPDSMIEFMSLVGQILRGIRNHPGEHRRRPRVDLDRRIDAEADLLRKAPGGMVEHIESILETAPIAAREALAELPETEAGVVARLALVGLDAARASLKDQD